MPMHLGDDFSRQYGENLPSPVKDIKCPDCGEPLPEDIQKGDVCCICGHVWS